MADISPDQILKASVTARWSALSALGGVSADLRNYDEFLLRDPRLLVPVDVQALAVRAGVNDSEGMVRLPFRTDDPSTYPPLDVHDPGIARPPGVYLLWTVPEALSRGTVVDDPTAPHDATRRRLDLPVLPDRWVVVRLAVPVGASDPLVAGWVIEAGAGTATPLADWPASTTNTVALATTPVPRELLNVHTGGTAWTQCYDAALGRLSIYDPLADLADTAIEGDAITYLVAGWWSVSEDDPLNGIGTDIAYNQRLFQLGWNDVDHPSSQQSRRDASVDRYRTATVFGLPFAARYTQPSQTEVEGVAGGGGSPPVPLTAQALSPAVSGFLNDVGLAAQLAPAPTQSTLLHGRIHGVPLNGDLGSDGRPATEPLKVIVGSNTPEVAGVVAAQATGLGFADADTAEQLLATFTAGLVMRLGESDTWADVQDDQHSHEFGSLPGGVEAIDRFVDEPAPPVDPGAGFRPGKVTGAATFPPAINAESTILWSALARPTTPTLTSIINASAQATARLFDGPPQSVPPPNPPPADQVRDVPRPAPRYEYPAAPVAAVVGGGRALSAVEREEADGALICRLSDQASRGLAGVLAASELLTSLGTGAVPSEVLDLARESLAEDPHLAGWRAERAAVSGIAPGSLRARFGAEAAVSYSYYTADNERLSGYLGTPVTSAHTRQRATEGLLRMSLSTGVWSHPEGVTMWGQPWRPMFCDWEVTLDLEGLDGWDLDGTDLDRAGDLTGSSSSASVVVSGRSALVTGAGDTLAKAIDAWHAQERQRDLGGHGLADRDTEESLARLQDTLARVDLLSVTFDGIRERLLGLDYDRGLVHFDTNADRGARRALALDAPQLLAAGRLTLTSARLVDAFGRVVGLPTDAVSVPQRLADTDAGALKLRPRLTAPSRWRFDLVDATSTSPDAPLACIDQVDPAHQVSPLAGFLLPDHMDESLEVFAADGTSLGELQHDPFSDAVTWEIAPGRTDVAPAAGPTDDPDVTHHRVGWIAAGLVAADAADRQATPERSESESSLSAMLRAIDTTLWNVDPFGSLGREHIAGLVGRPIAVVVARLSLDVYSDVEDRAYPADESGPKAARRAAYDALAELEFEVRLGEVTRSDDSLLGYFVDDDYGHFHVVDKVVVGEALPSGRGQGVLSDDPGSALDPVPITHPYIDPGGVLRIHPGQTIRLTLLMHPAGKVYLTSGVLPRVQRALARDWIGPGLSVIAPSLRSGPVLIDADKVRLPKIAAFPADQLFTRRDTPTSWKDDPILAATQSALLPDTSPEVQEGWVRINPNPSPSSSGGS